MHPRPSVPPTRRGRSAALAVVLAVLGPGWLAGPAAAEVDCDDPLVVHAPAGSSGETTAVAVTSQVIERGTPGWASVSWHAAEGTRLRAVVVVTSEGEHTLPADTSGTAGQVLELRFCGTSSASPTSDHEDETATPVRFASEGDDAGGVALGTTRASVLGAALGLVVGAVVLLMSRSSRRDPEVRP